MGRRDVSKAWLAKHPTTPRAAALPCSARPIVRPSVFMIVAVLRRFGYSNNLRLAPEALGTRRVMFPTLVVALALMLLLRSCYERLGVVGSGLCYSLACARPFVIPRFTEHSSGWRCRRSFICIGGGPGDGAIRESGASHARAHK